MSHLLVWIVPSPFNQHPLRIRVVPALVHLQPPRNQKEKGPACRRGVSSRMRCGMLSLGGRQTFCLSPQDASGHGGTGGGNASKGESEAGGGGGWGRIWKATSQGRCNARLTTSAVVVSGDGAAGGGMVGLTITHHKAQLS